jgi:type III pantothenate kinase
MLLAIDVGNTQTVAGVFQGTELLHRWRTSTVRTATLDELAAEHDGMLRLRGSSLADVGDMIVSSVVPALTAGYRDLAQRYLDAPALVVGPGVRTGMPIAIDNPHEVGADRIVNSVAAFRRFGGPCIVVDFGTATNFDCVSEAGEYLGGAIAPGIEVSVEALTSRAARLLKVELVEPDAAIGKSTVSALQSGILYGTVAMVDGLVARLKSELGQGAVVVATGGLSELIVPLSDQIDEHDPTLTLDGLRLIHELNAARAPR